MNAERFIFAVAIACGVSSAIAQQHVTTGPEIDYQPSIIRSTDDGARIVVFERLDPTTLRGDLWLTRSTDGGATWTTPNAIIATTANERSPALVQTGPHAYSLYYLRGESAVTSFRIWRTTSTDGIVFGNASQIDLGWSTGGEVNPHVIRHADSTLTMSYQRLGASAGVYVAESLNGGANFDTMKTEIAADAQLPRIAYRESDRRYLATYQTGSTNLSIFAKTTQDVRDWSGPTAIFAVGGNNHDSLPVVMPDDAFATFYIRASGDQFDIAVKRSLDGVEWSAPIAITNSPDADDVEPHPLVGTSTQFVELYWGRDEPAGSVTYDIVREAAVGVTDEIFSGSFDP